ncbi:hypothetical protein [Ovoidimarina sediminis]|uniref:hypothetical protein n=1 Tax=Ovoidimarina sediminis TaxID=3079856 RepID=UPI00290C2340|nr:hypothetical protein [Rhodophyticola sp. MJ-SS7]MDU8942661.1 hypothetical protein [Rhodophyticola sp. MJ-SS7]
MSHDPVGAEGSEDRETAGPVRARFLRVVAELFAGIAICAALVAMVDGFGP